MRADVVIVGAGVIGSSIALAMSRAGQRVVVVDKGGGAGHGSTAASSAIVRFNYSTWAGVVTSWDSKFAWEEWRDHVGAPAEEPVAAYHRTGLALLDVEIAPRELYLPSFDRASIPYEVWDAQTLAERVPGIDVGKYWPPARLDDERFWTDARETLGAVFTPDAGYVSDPQLAAQNLASAAQRKGAQFLLRRTVTDVLRTGDRASGLVLNDSDAISAPIVINAAGPWSSQLNKLADVGHDFTVNVRPMRHEVHHVSGPVDWDADGPEPVVIADLDLGIYLRGDIGGNLLIGGTEPACDPLEWLDDPEQAHPHVTQELFDVQVTRAARRLPMLSVPNAPRGVVGVYDVADDWTPIYDRTELPGFYVAIGTSGNQFKNAPVVGELMTTLIEAVESGTDHDRQPVQFTTRHTGHTIDLGTYSRRRERNASTGTVMG